jgi:hypothetical protein
MMPPMVSWPVCLGVRHPSGAHDQTVRHVRVSCCGAHVMMRGWVCNLLIQLLLSLTSTVTLGSKSYRTHDHILLSHLRLPTWRASSPYLYPPGTWWPSGGILTCLHARNLSSRGSKFEADIATDCESVSLSWWWGSCSNLKLFLSGNYLILHVGHPLWQKDGSYDWQVSRPVCRGVELASGTHARFFFYPTVAGFFRWGRPLWQEDKSVIYSYNCFWALPEQSLSGPRPPELTTIFYFLISDSPNLEGQVPVVIFPRNTVAQLYPPDTGFSFRHLLRLQGYGGGILTPLCLWVMSSLCNS